MIGTKKNFSGKKHEIMGLRNERKEKNEARQEKIGMRCKDTKGGEFEYEGYNVGN